LDRSFDDFAGQGW